MDERIQAKIASLADIKHSAPEAKDDDSLLSKLQREAYVLGGGIADGFSDNLSAPKLLQKAPEFAFSVAVGAGLAAAQGKTGLVKLGAEIAGLSFAYSFAKDLSDPTRLNGLSTAIQDTWHSPANLDINRSLVKRHGGDFAFDMTLMGAGGMIGAGGFRASRSETAQQLRAMIGEKAAQVGNMGRNAVSATELRAAGLGITEQPRSSMRMFSRDGDPSMPPMEVFPQVMKPGSSARRLVENAGERPLAEIHAKEKVTWEIQPGKEVDWTLSQDGVQVRLEAQRFVDAFMKRDYEGALRVAVEAPVMRSVDLNPKTRPHEVKISADELVKPEILQLRMNSLGSQAEFRWHQTVRDHVVDAQKLEVVIPRPVIELKSGTSVNLVEFTPIESSMGYRSGYKLELPERSTSGAPLNAADLAEIRAIRQSPEGQRLMAETSLFGYEEAIVHANQHITQGGRITSPSFAQFAADFASQSPTIRGHRLSFLGMIDNRHPMREVIFEQEVPALLYDAGMPLSVVRHHFFFGPRHVRERTPVMSFLENQDLILNSGK